MKIICGSEEVVVEESEFARLSLYDVIDKNGIVHAPYGWDDVFALIGYRTISPLKDTK
jgi:hypothetical protein